MLYIGFRKLKVSIYHHRVLGGWLPAFLFLKDSSSPSTQPLSVTSSPFISGYATRDLALHYKWTTNQAESIRCTVLKILNSQIWEDTHRCQGCFNWKSLWNVTGTGIMIKGNLSTGGEVIMMASALLYTREGFSAIDWIEEKSLKSYDHEILGAINPFLYTFPVNFFETMLCQWLLVWVMIVKTSCS